MTNANAMTMRATGLPLATVLEPILSGHERDHVSFERTGSTKTILPYGDSTEIGRTADRQPVFQLMPRRVTKLYTPRHGITIAARPYSAGGSFPL